MLPDPSRPVRIVLYVDATTHWHAGARLLGGYLRQAGGHVTLTSSLFLSGRRQRAMEKAKEILGLPEDRVELLGRPGIIEHTIPSVARQADADLVVIGRLGSADRLTSGFIAHLVAKRTPASVLIMRGRPQAIRSILVCTEGKRHGDSNFDCAAHIAGTIGARLDVLHVVDKMALNDVGRRELDEDLRDFLHSDAPEAAHLRALEQKLRERAIEGDVLVRAGLVVEEIVDALHEGEYGLLIIGAHDIGGPGGHLYEDFASRILRESPVTTLVVRDRERGGRGGGDSGPVNR